MRAAIISIVLLITLTGRADAAILYSIVDPTQGQGYVYPSIPTNLDQPLANPDIPFFVGLLAHQVSTGHFAITYDSNMQRIIRILDVNNLVLSSNVSAGVPLTLTQLAHAGGFDHFNFYQTFTHTPTDTFLYQENKLTGNDSLISLPYPDPITDSATNSLKLHSNITNTNATFGNDFRTDSSSLYFNENTDYGVSYKTVSTPTSIRFNDRPLLDPKYIDPLNSNDYLGFTTSLVCVKPNGDSVIFSGIGLSMDWKSNTTGAFTGGVDGGEPYIVGGTNDPGYGGRSAGIDPTQDKYWNYTGGTVYDVRIDQQFNVVPEPASLLLVVLSGFIVFAFKHSKLNFYV